MNKQVKQYSTEEKAKMALENISGELIMEQITSKHRVHVNQIYKWMVKADEWTNIFIERLWRLLKYKCVYLQKFENDLQAKVAVLDLIKFSNQDRPHSTLMDKTPDKLYS